MSAVQPLDQSALELLFTQGQISQNGKTDNFSDLMKKDEFLSNPLLYQTAINIINTYKTPEQLKSVIRAYEVLRCNKVASLPIHNLSFYDFVTPKKFSSLITSTEKILTDNFAACVQARAEMYAQGAELEIKLHQHTAQIEGLMEGFQSLGIDTSDWEELKKELAQGREADAIHRWNSLLAKIRAGVDFTKAEAGMSGTKTVELFVLDPLTHIKSIPPRNTLQVRFLSMLPEIENEIKEACKSDPLPGYKNKLDNIVQSHLAKTLAAYFDPDPSKLENELKMLLLVIDARGIPSNAPNLLSSLGIATLGIAAKIIGYTPLEHSEIPHRLFFTGSELSEKYPSLILDNRDLTAFSLQPLIDEKDLIEKFKSKTKTSSQKVHPVVIGNDTYITAKPPKIKPMYDMLTHQDFFSALKNNNVSTLVDLRMNSESLFPFLKNMGVGEKINLPQNHFVELTEVANVEIPDAAHQLQSLSRYKIHYFDGKANRTYTILQIRNWDKDAPPDPAVLRYVSQELRKEEFSNKGKVAFVDTYDKFDFNNHLGTRASPFLLYHHLSKSETNPINPLKALEGLEAYVRTDFTAETLKPVIETLFEDIQMRNGIEQKPKPTTDTNVYFESLLKNVQEIIGKYQALRYLNTDKIVDLLKQFAPAEAPAQLRISQYLSTMLHRKSREVSDNRRFEKTLENLFFLLVMGIDFSTFSARVKNTLSQYKKADDEAVLSVLDNEPEFNACFPEHSVYKSFGYLVAENHLADLGQANGPLDILRHREINYNAYYQGKNFDDTVALKLSQNMDFLKNISTRDLAMIPVVFFEKYIDKSNIQLLTPVAISHLTHEQTMALEPIIEAQKEKQN
ncbi:MAG: hypothetical protein WC222_00455 [Parachlamydiales bacterium]